MELARTESCANILRVSVHSKPPFRRYIVFAVLALLYALILPWIWSTMGKPLERAIEEARELDAKAVSQDFEEFDVVEIDIGASEETVAMPEESNSSSDFERPLPSPYLSDAGAMFSLFILVFFHSLFFLLCHWLVWFDIRAFYTPATAVTAGKYLHVVPFPHRGKSAICLIQRSSYSGKLEFTFQKQKFEINIPDERETEAIEETFQLMDGSKKQTLTKEVAIEKEAKSKRIAESTGFILPLSPDVKQTLGFFKKSRGFRNEEEIEKAAVRYGSNDLRADPPMLSNILFQQLLSPLAIFQLFSASLWFLDSYWQQAIFSFVMIIMMEFTTSFQRHRTAKMLRNLAPKPFQVLAFRGGSWMVIMSDSLLPGDIISLGSNGASASAVPCDCLILNGSAVVNEATLTGESVPQMKDSIVGSDSKETLDVLGKHRLHVLFSGTSLISVTPGEQRKTPNNGCLCYVLRTGFGSSQGELMQMIEFSTESVSDTKETGYALLILLIFALISSAYVFKVGLEKGKRTTHELLLRCVIIITQVVPQHLPVQMAAAVNYALIALNRKGILCTEPFRLPSGGKITHCFFDKTGTLTSDELVPVGIVNKQELETDKKGLDMLLPVHKANTETAMVLSSCHSLIALPTSGKSDEMPKLLGDPIEIAAVKGVQWTYYPSTETSKPGLDSKMIAKLKETSNKEDIAVMTKLAADLSKDSAISEIKIVSRYHFSSQLQRMSVVARVKFKKEGNKLACLVKGSPEAIRKLLKPDSIPERYEEVYQQMAEKGMRVLALGYKFVSGGDSKFSATNLHQLNREAVEEKLEFAGFVAFECKIRGDTKATIQALNNSDHKVTMVTGDALLTALHVAKECAICQKPQALLLNEIDNELYWQVATSSTENTIKIPFKAAVDGCGLTKLSEEYDLLLTEKMLQQAVSASNLKIWTEIDAVKVFARMSPPGKAEIIRYIQDKGNGEKLVFMCGDGGNDVGALKQADVGLALLSGFGSSNTQNVAAEGEDETTLNELDKLEAIKTRKATKAKKKEAAAIRKAIMKRQPDMVKAEVERRVANGEPQSISLQFSAAKAVTLQLQKEIKVEMQKLNAKYNIHKNKVTKNKEELSIFDKFKEAMEEQQNGGDGTEALGLDDGQVPIVRPGDASVAAPFTSRVPSIRSVVHLIRQGRCTLLSALQQQQTMMLECTISAYTMAALSLEGSRQSERQLLASSWLILTAVGSFSYSSPLETMHPVKPLKSLFHPAVILSIALQAVIHLWCISYGVKIAKAAMGDELLQEVIDFNYAAAKGLDKKLEELDDEFDPLASFMAMWEHPFKPNLLNTVVFLIQTAQTMAVYFVNYKGRPWMNGLLENHALFLSLFVAIGSVAVAAWEMLPFLNSILQLEPFPDDAFRVQVMILVILSIFGTFVVDRVVTAIFAPQVFRAMWESAKETTMKDITPIVSSLVKGLVILIVVGSSNPLIWAGAYWLYRRRKQYLEKQEEEELEQLEKRLMNKL